VVRVLIKLSKLVGGEVVKQIDAEARKTVWQ
jgi:hypothetical protein